MDHQKNNRWSRCLSIGLTIWFGCIISCTFFRNVLLDHGIPIWGEVHHFVVSSNGVVVVRDRQFDVTYWFNSSGQLCHYLKHGKRGSIAIDFADVVYFKGYHQLTVLNLYGEETNNLRQKHAAPEQNQFWEWQLGKDGQPVLISEELINNNVPPGTVQKNEPLFNRQGGHGGRTFLRADGTLYRVGIWSLQQQLPDGSWKTIVTIPWYLVPFTTPSLLALVLIIFVRGIIQDYRRPQTTVIKQANVKLGRNAFKLPYRSERVLEPTWDNHDASRKRWRFSLWRRNLPPVLISALEMKRRLGMLRGMSDCCWNDIKIMLNPGNHPEWGACLLKWKWYYMGQIEEALHLMESKVNECLSLNINATRDDVRARMVAHLQPFEAEIQKNRLEVDKPTKGWSWPS